MEEEKKAPKSHPVVTFRAPPIVLKQIKALCEVWGQNITQVIYRAIQSAYEREFGRGKK
jgi:hypothetical protein